jgi:type II secretory pathway component PulJ
MMKGFFRKFRLNNKGLTLLEAVIAILIISMVSVGVTSLFFSLSRLAKLSDTQLKLNTVMRVIKENVSKSVRDGTDIHGTGEKASNAMTETDKTLKDLPVKDLSEKEYSCVFDLTYDSMLEGVQKYWITIKRSSGGEVLTKYSIEVYAGGT